MFVFNCEACSPNAFLIQNIEQTLNCFVFSKYSIVFLHQEMTGGGNTYILFATRIYAKPHCEIQKKI